ncbi:MAG: Ldh family oxidoreductase [Planctomycetota bacterium]
MPRVDIDELKALGIQVLMKNGMSEEDARYVADVAVRTEAGGVHTHGVVMFGYLDRMLGDGWDPTAEPAVLKEKGATALLDCEGCVSHLALRKASELARAKAREQGVAMIAIRNGTWMGGLGSFILPLVRDGFFVQLWAQSRACKDSAPYGGTDPRFSTNPVGLGFPTATEPVIADFSTAVMSMGKVSRLVKQGKTAPEPCFFDKDGNVTDDPQKMKDGGAMFLWGGDINGYKGYAFALWAEALTAMAGGKTNNPELDQRQTINLTVIDPDAFAGAEACRAELDRFETHVKSSRVRAGFDGIRLPGERYCAALEDAEQNGVELDPDMLDTLNDLAEKHGLETLDAVG